MQGCSTRAYCPRLSPGPVKPVACAARRTAAVRAGADDQFQIFDSDDMIIDRTLGTTGIMKTTSYNPGLADTGEALGLDMGAIQQMSSQDASQAGITVRFYAGRITRGDLQGARVVMKAYPQVKGPAGREADAMAANELATHGRLQPPTVGRESPYVNKLLGGMVLSQGASAGEQWLLFRNDGVATAADYCQVAAAAGAKGEALGEGEFWDKWDAARPLQRRKVFILKVLRQVMEGLQFMHSQNVIHQSLGPGSVVLSSIQERDAGIMVARLRDFAFSVDVSGPALLGGETLAEIWDGRRVQESPSGSDFAEDLWRRARREGASSADAKRKFGIADDVYAAGLLLAYLVFVPLSAPGSVDGPTLQRLIETTFRGDFEAIRDYADADENWTDAVAFLDAADGAGWGLLSAMMNPKWELRPTAGSCLMHPFLKGVGVQ